MHEDAPTFLYDWRNVYKKFYGLKYDRKFFAIKLFHLGVEK